MVLAFFSLSLRLPCMCNGRIEAEKIYFRVCSQGAGAVDLRYIQPFFLLMPVCGSACLEALGGRIWDLASVLRSLLYVFPHFLFSFFPS